MSWVSLLDKGGLYNRQSTQLRGYAGSVGVAFDKLNHAYDICPPDMSPASSQVLIERWIVFLNFVDLIPTFEMDESWLENLAPHIVDSYYQAKERFHIDNSEKDTC